MTGFLSILKSPEGGPLGRVVDSIINAEVQFTVTCLSGTAPFHAVMAEMPSDARAAYLRKLVDNIKHVIIPIVSRAVMGKYYPSITFAVPQD